MRRGATGLAVLGAVTFLLAAWVSTASYVPIMRGFVPSEPSGSADRPPRTQSPSDQQPPIAKHGAEHGFDVGLTILLYTFLILLLLALAALVLHRVVIKRRLRRKPIVPAEAELADDGWELAVSDDLTRSAARGLAALSEGEPRNAIVRCWVELEDAVERIGLQRDPALTSEEFTSAVLERYAVGRTQIEALGALYREARFSEHPLGETHRSAAIRALTALRDELGRAEAGEQPVTASESGQ